jgi:integrase
VDLTRKLLLEITPPENGMDYLYDNQVTGLYACIQPSGHISFRLRSSAGKSLKRVTLGIFPTLTIDQARERAKRTLGTFRYEISTEVEEYPHDAPITLGRVFNDYLKVRTLKPSTIRDYHNNMKNTFGDWQNILMTDITGRMVIDRHRERGKISEARANDSNRMLRSLFNFAMSEYENENDEQIITRNPVLKLTQARAWFKPKRRQTMLFNHEIKAWFDAVKNLPLWYPGRNAFVSRDFLLLMLFTGLRFEEAASLQWMNVVLNNKGMLVIHDTKNSLIHRLPLSDYILDILGKRRSQDRTGQYVFAVQSKRGYITKIDKTIAAITEKTGIRITAHDLRRTFITIAERLDYGRYTSGK